MRVSANFGTAFQNTILNVNRAAQNGAQRGKGAIGFGSAFQQDSVSISPQARASSMIDHLTQQKMEIQDRKNSFMESALKEGQSIDSIQGQLESYDEQIQNIDKQIAQTVAQQMKEAAEEKKNTAEKQDDTPKTEQEIENQKMSHLMELSTGMDKVAAIDSVKAKVDGSSGVLETEIELDKMRSNGMKGSLEAIAKKEAELADLQAKSSELSAEIGQQMSDLTQKIEENDKPVEKAQEEQAEDPDAAQEDENANSEPSDTVQTTTENS